MSIATTGAILGLTGGAGATLAVSRLPMLRRPSLEDRVEPYLRDTTRPSRLLVESRTRTPFPTLERLLAPVLADAVRILDRWVGGSASVRRRLDQLGDRATLEEFRAEQLVWGGLGLAAGLGLVLVVEARGGAHPVALALVVLACGVLGILLRDRSLTRQVREREQRMLLEFPTIAELLALSVAAGEGASGALERVTARSSGALAEELARALADTRSGAPLLVALERLAERTSLPDLRRFVDGIVIAVERGTPLTDVLRAQAVDVREAGRRRLIESGGRREIAMMVPVVFFLLPLTVVFALFPGFYGLSLGSS
jgi:tight adherence protein C